MTKLIRRAAWFFGLGALGLAGGIALAQAPIDSSFETSAGHVSFDSAYTMCQMLSNHSGGQYGNTSACQTASNVVSMGWALGFVGVVLMVAGVALAIAVRRRSRPVMHRFNPPAPPS